jgi:hypothetical protein
VCRDFARQHGREAFGQPVGEVGRGTVADPASRNEIEIDVAVLGSAVPGAWRQVVSIGEAKWGDVMGLGHLDRLGRARAPLEAKGFDTSETALACYAGNGGDEALRAEAARHRVLLVDPPQLYGRPAG